MTSETELKDALTRTIVLMYGLVPDGEQYWVYAAIKPSKYSALLSAQKDGTLDLQNFKPYGEIIVSGKGKTPPDEVTLKVAEMYQTDPAVLLAAKNENNS
jgi:hypothetical protein